MGVPIIGIIVFGGLYWGLDSLIIEPRELSNY